MPRVLLAAGLLALLLAAAPASAGAQTSWLCRPSLRTDPCRAPLAARAVAADGSSKAVPAPAHRARRVDCFYVYPTVVNAATVNAPATAEPAVVAVAQLQVSRFSPLCRMYAPLYRQVTTGGLFHPDAQAGIDLAYRDVRAAWREYLRRDNHGRGVVFLGHSQGTGMLRRLLREEVDPRRSVRRRVVSAVLLGGNVKVRRGSDRGGDFRAMRACRSARQIGCVIAYSTYDTPPPGATAVFGKTGFGFDLLFGGPTGQNLRVLCTNPASLGGGSAPLRSFVRAAGTPAWTTYPGLYRGRCRSDGGVTWLQADAAANDPRPKFAPLNILGLPWGLHLFDFGVALGDLTDVVRTQAAAYVRRAD